jgi:DNA-binding response OmpR family regulator
VRARPETPRPETLGECYVTAAEPAGANRTTDAPEVIPLRVDPLHPRPHLAAESGAPVHQPDAGRRRRRYYAVGLRRLPILAGMLSAPHAPRILLVDDDPNLLVLLADQLRADGYEISTARDGDEALRRLRSSWPDLLIIDMMMSRMDGLTLAREIKSQADLPIIVLSAIDAGDSKADLLEEVAEDYVTKPYHYPELRARINRVLRRLGDKVPRQSLRLGSSLTLDLHRREATVGGQVVQLTPTESRLLYALAANLGQTVTTETLLARGWAETEDADPSYVWVTMRRLRQKVEVDPNRPAHVQTVRGVGYRLVAATSQKRSGD